MDREEWKQEKKGKTRSKQANQEAKARLFNDKFLGENTISYTPHQFWRRGVFSIEHLFFHWKATWEPNETGGDKKEEAICHQLSLRLLMRNFQLKINFSDAFSQGESSQILSPFTDLMVGKEMQRQKPPTSLQKDM